MKAVAGNYVFIKESDSGWSYIYIGKTNDLSTRFDDYHKMQCIKKNGATHVGVYANAYETDRTKEVAKWNITCNKINN